ncbi:MAG: hypothetical protein KME45_31710 [Stenomitos rutilans HA7619-LM2]|jgi:hypothetical protein|nr:hypothetical protein [Stenomitos rutilans HA7619-LM2]
MTYLWFPNYSSEDLPLFIQQKIESWRLLSQSQIQRISYDDRCEIAQLQLQDGESRLAQARIHSLQPIAQRRWSRFHQQLMECFTIFLGALIFSILPKSLAKAIEYNSLSLGIGLLGGGVATWLTHDCATRGLGKIRCRQDSLQALKLLTQQHQTYPVHNEFVDQFFEGQKTRLLEIEASNLKVPFWIDITLAIAASLLEGVAAFISVQSGNSDDQLLAVFASLFPVTVIWLAAVFQSDRVEFAAACTNLVQAYSTLLPTSEVSEEQVLRVCRLDAAFKHFTQAIPSSTKTITGANACAVKEFAQKRIDQLEAEGIQAVKDRKFQYRQDIESLSQRFPKLERAVVSGYREFEVPPQQRQVEQEQANQIAEEVARLTIELEEDLSLLQIEYVQQIQRWLRIKGQAAQEFDQAETD